MGGLILPFTHQVPTSNEGKKTFLSRFGFLFFFWLVFHLILVCCDGEMNMHRLRPSLVLIILFFFFFNGFEDIGSLVFSTVLLYLLDVWTLYATMLTRIRIRSVFLILYIYEWIQRENA